MDRAAHLARAVRPRSRSRVADLPCGGWCVVRSHHRRVERVARRLPMRSADNQAIFRRVIEEGFGQGNLAVLDELMAPDFIEHEAGPGEGRGWRESRRSSRCCTPPSRTRERRSTVPLRGEEAGGALGRLRPAGDAGASRCDRASVAQDERRRENTVPDVVRSSPRRGSPNFTDTTWSDCTRGSSGARGWCRVPSGQIPEPGCVPAVGDRAVRRAVGGVAQRAALPRHGRPLLADGIRGSARR